MRETYHQPEMEQFDEHRMEIENRIKNLCWTVSGDYTLDIKPDVESFAKSKYIALYDAIKQGAFGKYFDSKQLGLYIMKKVYLSADEKPLLEIAQLCVDTAVYPLIARERLGIDDIRKEAFSSILKYQDAVMTQTYFGRIKKFMMKSYLKQQDKKISEEKSNQTKDKRNNEMSEGMSKVLNDILSLENAENTDDIIRVIDQIYNTVYDNTFEKKHGNLNTVLRLVPIDIAKEFWKECMTDEQMEDIIKLYLSDLDDNMMSLNVDNTAKPAYLTNGAGRSAEEADTESVDEEAIQKVEEYVELNYGQSYLTPLERERKMGKLCRGIHAQCVLHFTDGILHAPKVKNNQYRFSQLQFEKNRMYYYNNHWVVKRNVAVLADTLKKALVMRQEEDICRAVTGQLVPARLWKLNKSEDVKLFDKKLKSDNSEFVVDILLDASGSQAKRQSQVAAQGYIISEALSQAGIAHRVSSYSTFWDHTILQKFRDYDDDKDANMRIFEFRASANNRDGLALKAACDALAQRPEDNKILIVLSDGKPNDVGTNRPGTRRVKPYIGKEAVKDTAFEVRRARTCGICVLGIFAGSEDDLPMEKKIYGKDFAYIRNISNFSRIVGSYLRRQIDACED